MELPKHPELTALALVYAEARDRRMAALREEKVHKDALMAMMHSLNLEVYEDPDDEITVTIETEEKLKVKAPKDDGELE